MYILAKGLIAPAYAHINVIITATRLRDIDRFITVVARLTVFTIRSGVVEGRRKLAILTEVLQVVGLTTSADVAAFHPYSF